MLTENDVENQQTAAPVVIQAVDSLDLKYLVDKVGTIARYTGYAAFFLFWMMLSQWDIKARLDTIEKDTSVQVLLQAILEEVKLLRVHLNVTGV